jgi:hypothetical protein
MKDFVFQLLNLGILSLVIDCPGDDYRREQGEPEQVADRETEHGRFLSIAF